MKVYDWQSPSVVIISGIFPVNVTAALALTISNLSSECKSTLLLLPHCHMLIEAAQALAQWGVDLTILCMRLGST